MASEPYCADAPSRSTSIRWIALPGIRSRSGGDWPFCTDPLMNNVAELCRRLPFTNTSNWSPPRPRSDSVRTAQLAPAPLFDTLMDGTSVPSRSRTDCLPLASRSLAPRTSIGARLSATVRLVARVPVTMIGVESSIGSGAGASAAGATLPAVPACANWSESGLRRAALRLAGAASAITPAPACSIFRSVPASRRPSASCVDSQPWMRRLRIAATSS